MALEISFWFLDPFLGIIYDKPLVLWNIRCKLQKLYLEIGFKGCSLYKNHSQISSLFLYKVGNIRNFWSLHLQLLLPMISKVFAFHFPQHWFDLHTMQSIFSYMETVTLKSIKQVLKYLIPLFIEFSLDAFLGKLHWDFLCWLIHHGSLSIPLMILRSR